MLHQLILLFRFARPNCVGDLEKVQLQQFLSKLLLRYDAAAAQQEKLPPAAKLIKKWMPGSKKKVGLPEFATMFLCTPEFVQNLPGIAAALGIDSFPQYHGTADKEAQDRAEWALLRWVS